MSEVYRLRVRPPHASLVFTIFLILRICGGSDVCHAQDRHFVYSYDSPNLPAGGVDIEPWITFKWGGGDRLQRIYEQRLEFELGIFRWLQTSFYLNLNSKLIEKKDSLGNTIALQPSTSFSFSQAIKFAFLNPSVHPVGLGMYIEYYLYPHETELEGKLIIDKWLERHIFLVNITGEYELEYELEEEMVNGTMKREVAKEHKFIFNPTFGYMYMVRRAKPVVGLGAEAYNHQDFKEGRRLHSAWYAGPTFLIARSTDKAGFFLIGNLSPQLTQVYEGHQQFMMRFILGITF